MIYGFAFIFMSLTIWLSYKKPRLMLVAFWSFAASLLVAAALLALLPGNFTDRALWIALFLPLFWLFLQLWSFWQERIWKIYGTLGALCILGLTVVLVMEPVL